MLIYKVAYTVLDFLSSGSFKKKKKRVRYVNITRINTKHKGFETPGWGVAGCMQGGEGLFLFLKPGINFCSICNDG